MKLMLQMRQHPIKSLLFVLVAIFLVTLIYTGIRDNRRQQQVSESLDNLTHALSDQGFGPINRTSGCGRLQTKMGDGPKRCNEGLNISVPVKTEADADTQLVFFKNVLDVTNEYHSALSDSPLPEHMVNSRGTMSGWRHYIHKESGAVCFIPYNYNDAEMTIVISMDCDVTSWYTENIDRGWFGIELGP